MKEIKVKATFIDEVLATQPADREIYDTYIATKATDVDKELVGKQGDALPEDEDLGRMALTVFPQDEEGRPLVWPYQVKGYFKDSCGMLRRVKESKSAKLTAHKKEIDGLVFVEGMDDPDRIVLNTQGHELGVCQRPLRISSAAGERVALAKSQSAPKGTTMEFKIVLLKDSLEPLVREWLDYGRYHGFLQWRNSGKGRFTWEEVE